VYWTVLWYILVKIWLIWTCMAMTLALFPGLLQSTFTSSFWLLTICNQKLAMYRKTPPKSLVCVCVCVCVCSFHGQFSDMHISPLPLLRPQSPYLYSANRTRTKYRGKLPSPKPCVDAAAKYGTTPYVPPGEETGGRGKQKGEDTQWETEVVLWQMMKYRIQHYN